MKRILPFLLFLITSNVLGQQYELKITNYNYWMSAGGRDVCDPSIRFTHIYITLEGSNREIEVYKGSAARSYSKSVLITKKFKKKIKRIRFKSFFRRKDWFGSCSGDTSELNVSQTISNNGNCEVKRSISTADMRDDARSSINFDYTIRPLVDIDKKGQNSIIGFDSPLQLGVTAKSKGFHSSVYHWEYQTVSRGLPNRWAWNSMPTSVQGKVSFSIKPAAFLRESDIGKRIYFRIRTCGSWWSNLTTDVVYFRVTRTAPKITRVTTKPPSCYDSNDGEATVQLSRALKTGEMLSIAVRKNGAVAPGKTNLTRLEPGNKVTLKGLSKASYNIKLTGAIPGYNGKMVATYIDNTDHNKNFNVAAPSPVAFKAAHSNVWCHGGKDGKIVITAWGGQVGKRYQYLLQKHGSSKAPWRSFKNSRNGSVTETISNLAPGTYNLNLRDANHCMAKIITRNKSGAITGLGNVVTKTIKITQPNQPLKVAYTYHKQPTAFGFSNGILTAKITGGTPLAGKKYNATWTHENGKKFTYTAQANSEGWFITINNAIAGNYNLTVTDANYTRGSQKAGCSVINSKTFLDQPPKLELSVTKTNPISCNNTNSFNDESSDGQLTATASGGVPFSPLLQGKYRYKYTWKKKGANGNYRVIPYENGPVLSNRDTGEYAVNIEDKNGIVIGRYVNNALQSPTDVTYHLEQPPLLEIHHTKQDVYCYQGADGAITTKIVGGTGTYKVEWSNGETTPNISNLVAGDYHIYVTDEKGCQAAKTITINEPLKPLKITYNFFNPTFYQATNGWIKATVTGGTPYTGGSYAYTWVDAAGNDLKARVSEKRTKEGYEYILSGIPEGTYYLTIQDKNHYLADDKPNCTIVRSEYKIQDPEPLVASVKMTRPISCNTANTYGDPYADGTLEVYADGGVKLQPEDNNGLPYYYTWKKETSLGVWTVLPSQTTNIASGLDVGHYAVNIEDANGIILGVYEYNVLKEAKDIRYNFPEPPLLELSFEKQDVYCHEGSDGWAKALLTGGVPPYNITWSTGEKVPKIRALEKGTYTVKITDKRGCQVSGSITIDQPKAPTRLTYTAFATPSTANASNGWIEAQVTGGTKFSDGSYTYYWQDANGNLLNHQTQTTVLGDRFQIRLNNIPKGTYHLTIEDAQYNQATTKEGCTHIEEAFTLYDPIEAVITVERPISCHQDNAFANPYSDGKLKATVTGGLPFSSGQGYSYYWKKQQANGQYEDIHQDSPIAVGLSDGKYALNVVDSRGVVIGVYESDRLQHPTDVLFTFEEPKLLTLALSATHISCDQGNNGTATVAISGGIPPYDIQWSNGDTTETAVNLIGGNHKVFVTDARGCEATGTIELSQPGGLSIAVIAQKNPNCKGYSDGAISLEVTGGEQPYTYAWNTGEETMQLTNLTEGHYRFSLTDANGCKVFQDFVLEDPSLFTINVGKDKTLCKEQSHVVDATIEDPKAVYAWASDNGFTSSDPIVSLTKEGTYTLTVTTDMGCIASDSLTISANTKAIAAEFLMSSQAYTEEEVILFNVSNPASESFEWILPAEASIVQKDGKTTTLRFSKKGTYTIGLLSKEGGCTQEQYKKIVVEEAVNMPELAKTDTLLVTSFQIVPNPNKGDSEVTVDLAEASPISLRIYNAQGEFIFKQQAKKAQETYHIPLALNLASGMYVVILETAKITKVKRMVVK